MAKVAYIRVSTQHQRTERQEYAMPEGIDKTFIDKASGKDTEREQFKAMLDYVREGDTVYFESFSRISRSLSDLLNILDTFNKKGVAWVSLKEQIDTSNAAGRLHIQILGAVAQYERDINKERREYGYKIALCAGRVGRPEAEVSEQFKAAVKAWRGGEITATEAIKRAGVGRTTFYKLVKIHDHGGAE